MSEGPRTHSTVNAGRSLRSIVLLGLLGLGGLVFLLWPKAPAVEHGQIMGGGATWELHAEDGEVAFRGPTMGTRYSVILNLAEVPEARREAAELDAVLAEIEAELSAVNLEMSTYLEHSELSRFNAGPAGVDVPASAHLLEVVGMAREVTARSGGAFDITVGPLVDAWGFGPPGPPGQGGGEAVHSEPPAAELEILRARVGDDKLSIDLEAGTLRKSVPGLRVDLSAIAKGHGCDRVADVLEARGFDAYMVEIGGEIRVRGSNPDGESWRVGIERPSADAQGARALHSILPITDAAMATSGDYRNYWEKDGVRYSHTVDPRTGRPIAHTLASVTVVHPDSAALADAWATALNVLGPDEGLALATREGLAAYFLVRTPDGYETRSTPTFEALTP